jgi:hypothetical protein
MDDFSFLLGLVDLPLGVFGKSVWLAGLVLSAISDWHLAIRSASLELRLPSSAKLSGILVQRVAVSAIHMFCSLCSTGKPVNAS